MSGIIIYIPPAPEPPIINPTSEVIPVADGGNFIDSNINNYPDNLLQTRSTITLDPKGIILDFVNNLWQLGDPYGINIVLNSNSNILNINGATLDTPTVFAEKLLPVTIDGQQYYIQLYLPTP